MHCKPRHKPKVGIFFSLANFRAPSLPSIPRTPNPPGTQIASTPSSDFAAPSEVSQSSLATHLIFTFALLENPPARRASVTERYASGKSTYLLQKIIPFAPHKFSRRQTKATYYIRIQTFIEQNLWYVIN